MGRRRITVADIKEVLVAWDAGESVSAIARMFGYTRPTVRKYVHAAEHVGLARGGDVLKASRRDLAVAVAHGRTAATTVAAA